MLENIPIKKITESSTNPRRTFDDHRLSELADSIKEHGVLQPILVASCGKFGYDLVAGARRLRAAKLAGLKEIPATVRDLDKKQCIEMQLIENLQREDLHPMEEAQGYRQALDETNSTVTELAHKLGRSESYVYRRLQLCNLSDASKESFRTGEIDVGRAILLAGLSPDLQAEALEAFLSIDYNDNRMTLPQCKDFLAAHILRKLKTAPFPTGNALLTTAGSCAVCPHRTGAQPQLFGDVTTDDHCTNGKCWATKVEAWWKLTAKKAKQSKQAIVTDPKLAQKLINTYHQAQSPAYGLPGIEKTWGQLADEAKVSKTLVKSPYSGAPLELINRKELTAALPDLFLATAATGSTEASDIPAGTKKRDETRGSEPIEKDPALENRIAVVEDLLPTLVRDAEATPSDKVFLQVVLWHVLSFSRLYIQRRIEARRGIELPMFDGDEYALDFLPAVEEMNENQLRGLLLEIIASDDPEGEFREDYSPGLYHVSRLFCRKLPFPAPTATKKRGAK